MDERTEHTDLSQIEFAEKRLPLRLCERNLKIGHKGLDLHAAGRPARLLAQTQRTCAQGFIGNNGHRYNGLKGNKLIRHRAWPAFAARRIL